jgi:5-methylthioribose kinase
MTRAVADLSGYVPLDPSSVPAYLDAHPELRAIVPGRELHVREVGDGNLNLVFVVRDDPDRPGVVLKQSLPYVRVHGESWPLTIERVRHEADAYRAYAPFAGDAIPRIHGFDAARHVLAMEDLADLRIWRGALNDGEIHPGAAEALGRLVAGIAFWTSDAAVEPEARKGLATEATNPELCRITEDLIFTEPYIEHERNRFAPGLAPLVAELRSDRTVLTEIALLKHRFLTHAEARIHGDLHTGSVMVGGGRTVAIDPEFAFYGPVGFDLGALWANGIIAAARARVLDRDTAFREHVAANLPDSWQAFERELRARWPERRDRSLGDGFLDRRLVEIWDDALGFAAAKAIRRMIGYAHVTDIETLEEDRRAIAAGAVLRVARRLLTDRRALTDPAAVRAVVEEALP